jgi:hypothetical protein
MPIQRWRCPVVLRAKSGVFAAAGMAVAVVFFPLWFAVPVMAVLGVWGLGMCVRRSEVVLDSDDGLLVLRLGPITRRLRLASITAVQVDGAKVSIARSGGGVVSVYVWRRSRLDSWLRMPVVAGDVAHAVSFAAAAAAAGAAAAAPAAGKQAQAVPEAPEGRAPLRRPSRQRLTVALLGCTGVLEVVAALLVRVTWPNPVMTVLGVMLAFALGLSGIFHILFPLWLLLTKRAPAVSRDRASAA